MPPLLRRLTFSRLLLSALLALSPLGAAPGAVAATNSDTASSPTAKSTANTKPVKQKTSAAKKVASKKTNSAKSKSVASKTSAKSSAVKSRKTAAKPTAPAKPVAQVAKPVPPAFKAAERDAYPNVAKAYLVKVGKDVIWEGEAEKRLPPASLTKMMTALLVVESYRPNDIVTISPAAADETGSRIGLRPGDRLQLADLLAATLVRSANDACHSLADWHSGSEAAFVVRMNQRAEQLGLRDTHFENACGHDHPDHYSSAHDLAVIAEAALKNPAFAHIVEKPRLAIRSVDGRRTFRFKSTNHLIGVVDGVQGVKTGFTEGAGPCLVAMAERNDTRVLLVLLNARNRWWNATAMIDNAFAHAPNLAAKKAATQQASNAPAAPPARSAARNSGVPLAGGV